MTDFLILWIFLGLDLRARLEALIIGLFLLSGGYVFLFP